MFDGPDGFASDIARLWVKRLGLEDGRGQWNLPAPVSSGLTVSDAGTSFREIGALDEPATALLSWTISDRAAWRDVLPSEVAFTATSLVLLAEALVRMVKRLSLGKASVLSDAGRTLRPRLSSELLRLLESPISGFLHDTESKNNERKTQ